LLAHVFLEQSGELSVAPAPAIRDDDFELLAAAVGWLP
jgi:hypothetical protein